MHFLLYECSNRKLAEAAKKERNTKRGTMENASILVSSMFDAPKKKLENRLKFVSLSLSSFTLQINSVLKLLFNWFTNTLRLPGLKWKWGINGNRVTKVQTNVKLNIFPNKFSTHLISTKKKKRKSIWSQKIRFRNLWKY